MLTVRKLILGLWVTLATVWPPLAGASQEKLKSEELVARHLASIGSPEDRANRTGCTAEGTSRMTTQLGSLGGPAFFFSEGRKLCMSFLLNYENYPSEEVAFDGEKVTVSYKNWREKKRSALGGFVLGFQGMVKEGLWGGVLSTAWPLLDLEGRSPKLKYKGLKKVDGKELHRLEYKMQKGGRGFKITLYFEQTYRHVLTTYSGQLGRTWYKLEESFSDFRLVDGLTLPLRRKLHFSLNSGESWDWWDWETVYHQIAHNQSIEVEVFVIEHRGSRFSVSR